MKDSMEDLIAERKPMRVYRDGGKTWIPHYKHPGVFVTQGGKTKSRFQLMAEDATPDWMDLWPRKWMK